MLVQDQSSPKPGKWTKTGKIVEVQDFDSYLIKIDGSNHITKRNRQFLRKIIPYIEKSAGSSETPKPNATTNSLHTSNNLPAAPEELTSLEIPPPKPAAPEPIAQAQLPPPTKPVHQPPPTKKSNLPKHL